MIKFNFKNFITPTSSVDDVVKCYDAFLHEKKMAGWYDLKDDNNQIKQLAHEIKEKADIFIVIGIGGSYLGSKAVIEALTPCFNNSTPEIIFAGHDLSSDYITELLNYIKNKSTYINVISKSGTTLETLVTFNILLEYMQKTYDNFNERIIVTTENRENNLFKLAKEHNLRCLYIPNDIGGRYSVLTAVGLLPIAVAGIDIDELLTGAREAKQNLHNCFEYVNIRNQMYKSNKFIESFDIYEPKLYYFTEWLKQLFAESQGKNNKGILPISTVNTRDLHSLGQFYQEGTPIIFSTTIYTGSNYDIKVPGFKQTLSELNKTAMDSVIKAHYPHTMTNIIEIDKLNPKNIGYLIFFFEMSAMLGSYLLNVNYYDQPGVNEYKEIMHKKIDGE